MQRSIALFILFTLSGMGIITTQAQIEGVSGSKISAYGVEVIGHGLAEFEPSANFSISRKHWDHSGKLRNSFLTSDSLHRSSGTAFRFSYGLWDKLEFGGTIASIPERARLGLRYVLMKSDNFGLAALAGAGFPVSAGSVDRKPARSENVASAGLGLAMSLAFNENLSLDVNAQGESFMKPLKDKHHGSYYLNADLGWYTISGQLQFIAGLGYQFSGFDSGNSRLLSVYPGITLEMGEKHILVLAVPFDVMGKNAEKTTGICIALTLLFD